jgi:hypothetical protein
MEERTGAAFEAGIQPTVLLGWREFMHYAYNGCSEELPEPTLGGEQTNTPPDLQEIPATALAWSGRSPA